MLKSLLILGRQPALGLAELESLFGAKKIQPLSGAALLDIDASSLPFQRLGGTVKLAKVITRLNSVKWSDIETHLLDNAAHHLKNLPAGKLKLGLSVYGLADVSVKTLERAGLRLKKSLQSSGRSARLVPNQALALNSAQVLHNNLTGPLGWELIVIADGDSTILAQTAAVQNINAYAARDQARPKRDPKVGMLPPKLAQIIINLATGSIEPQLAQQTVVLDPFCGTGVVLQEALLMGYSAYGADVEPRMIEYAKGNLEWLNAGASAWKLEQADATKYRWQQPFDVLASETYLGQPYAALPPPEQLNKNIDYVNRLHEKFLKNLGQQVKSGFRLCLAVPAWKLPGGFRRLPCLANLKELGYNRLQFVHVKNDDLIYHREGQVVARELVIMTRI